MIQEINIHSTAGMEPKQKLLNEKETKNRNWICSEEMVNGQNWWSQSWLLSMWAWLSLFQKWTFRISDRSGFFVGQMFFRFCHPTSGMTVMSHCLSFTGHSPNEPGLATSRWFCCSNYCGREGLDGPCCVVNYGRCSRRRWVWRLAGTVTSVSVPSTRVMLWQRRTCRMAMPRCWWSLYRTSFRRRMLRKMGGRQAQSSRHSGGFEVAVLRTWFPSTRQMNRSGSRWRLRTSIQRRTACRRRRSAGKWRRKTLPISRSVSQSVGRSVFGLTALLSQARLYVACSVYKCI